MLYQEYKQRLSKLMDAFETAWRFRFLILLAVVLVIAIIATLLGITGIIYQDVCPETVEYGCENFMEAKAIFRQTSFEFREKGEQNWSESKPLRVGAYEIRAVSTSITGANKYGKVHACNIIPLQTELTVSENTLVYGDDPTAKAELVYSDRIVSSSYVCEQISDNQCLITVSAGSVLNGDGEDVTACYSFIESVCSVTITPRPITVVVEDAVKTYDGTPLQSDTYHIGEGALVEGDELKLSFPNRLTRVGEISNIPTCSVSDSHGEDVSALYQITVQAGMLRVEQRELFLNTGSAEKEYDAFDLSYPEFDVDESTSLVSGHRIEADSFASVTDVGVYENTAVARIFDSDGNDVSDYYNVSYKEKGTLTITPRPLRIETESYSWTYDGWSHSYQGFEAFGLIDGHAVQALNATEVKNVADSGTENVFSVEIFEQDREITANYEISYVYGTLTVLPREITVYTDDKTWVYDGNEHVCEELLRIYPRLIDGHHWVVDGPVTAIREIGQKSNVFSCRFLDENDDDVTGNYAISYDYGTLTIAEIEVTVWTGSQTWVYDGQPHICEEGGISELLEGDKLELIEPKGIVDAGEQKNIWKAKITNAKGEDRTRYYLINYAYGTLTVLPRKVVIWTASKTWIHDGQSHSLAEIGNYGVDSESGYDLLAGHRLELIPESLVSLSDITDTEFEVGYRENSLEFEVTDESGRYRTSNYDISYHWGQLRIKTEIIISVYSLTKYYDGKPLSFEEGDYFIVKPPDAEVELELPSITDTGIVAFDALYSIPLKITDKASGRDVRDENRYRFEGNADKPILEIIPRHIEITSISISRKNTGSPLRGDESANSAWISQGSLAQGHSIEIIVSGILYSYESEIENTIESIRIFDEAGRDVTDNYSWVVHLGTLQWI